VRRFLLLPFIFLLIGGFLHAQELSGILTSTHNYTAGAGDAPANSWGSEEYANMRLTVKAGKKAVLYSAINLIAASGNYLENASMQGGANPDPSLASTSFVYGQNYAAAMELERLYFRINGDYLDTEAGLLRINFGYGQVWGSSDFLNPRNPLFPDARPRGVLGMDCNFYPSDSLKIMAFAASPKDPLQARGGGFLPGLSLDKHWNKASVQALYSFETPLADSPWGIHRFGLSVKADMVLGFVVDTLYTFDPNAAAGIEGLSLGSGFDYSFLGGDLYILFEYLFNGSASSTAWNATSNLLGWGNHNYLYGTALYRFNDYTSLALSTVFCFDDLSFSPFVTLSYDVFQGFNLSLTARLPLDEKTISGGRAGELGPVPPDQPFNPDGSPGTMGSKLFVELVASLRF